jgi:hypothetical protein
MIAQKCQKRGAFGKLTGSNEEKNGGAQPEQRKWPAVVISGMMPRSRVRGIIAVFARKPKRTKPGHGRMHCL